MERKGKITSINNQIIMSMFGSNFAPKIGSIIYTKDNKTKKDKDFFEVGQILIKNGKKTVVAHKLTSSFNIKIDDLVYTKEDTRIIKADPNLLGGIINILGEDLVDRNFTTKKIVANKNKKAKKVNKERIVETGIKILDLLLPIRKGGKAGLIGGAGVGKSVFIEELMNSFVNKYDGFLFFAGVGERIREGHEFYLSAKDKSYLNRSVFLFSQMNEVPGARARAVDSVIDIADQFRDKYKKDSLIFIDNIYRHVQAKMEISPFYGNETSELGYQPNLSQQIGKLQERINSNQNGAITSVQSVYLPADDQNDPAIQSITPHFDSLLFLEREMAAKGIYPAINPLKSSSLMLNEKYVSQDHFKTAKRTLAVLEKYYLLEEIISILGKSKLSEENKKVYELGKRLELFFAQPFKVAEKFTYLKGKTVPLNETIASVKKILTGELNHIPYELFKYRGSISEVEEAYEEQKQKEIGAKKKSEN